MQWLQRSVGLAIIGAAGLGAAALWVAVAAGDPQAGQAPDEGLLLGIWQVFYDTEMPAPRVLLAAVGVALLLAAAVAGLERRLLTRARRSEDGNRMPLAPKIVMAETRGQYAGPVTITGLIPAHNEEGCISQTLDSLLAQEPPPARIVVVADNCTDGTVASPARPVSRYSRPWTTGTRRPAGSTRHCARSCRDRVTTTA